MDQVAVEPKLPDAVRDALESAVQEYCLCLREIADETGRGRAPSPEQIDRAEAAKLHLENARTLLELHVYRDASAVPRRQRVH
jgi:hypothetical protein